VSSVTFAGITLHIISKACLDLKFEYRVRDFFPFAALLAALFFELPRFLVLVVIGAITAESFAIDPTTGTFKHSLLVKRAALLLQATWLGSELIIGSAFAALVHRKLCLPVVLLATI
jgi:hypothetical protein